jgi:hypothetical protein
MSSTKPIPRDTLQASLRQLANPLYEALTASRGGLPPFPLGPAEDLPSYYTQRAQTSMRPADFLAPSCLDAVELRERLAAHWRAAGQPQLAELAPRVAAIAHAMHALYVAAKPQATVSPYVYQMF